MTEPALSEVRLDDGRIPHHLARQPFGHPAPVVEDDEAVDNTATLKVDAFVGADVPAGAQSLTLCVTDRAGLSDCNTITVIVEGVTPTPTPTATPTPTPAPKPTQSPRTPRSCRPIESRAIRRSAFA